MRGLSRRQAEILTLIRSFTQAKGYPPSYRDLTQALGLQSTGTLYTHIQNLKDLGHLDSRASKLTLTKPVKIPNAPTLPVIGQIAKGEKLELFAKVSTFDLPASLSSNNKSNLYGFVIKDQSFAELYMQQNDLIVVDTSKEAEKGNLVLVKSASRGTEIGHYAIHQSGRLLQITDESISIDEENMQIQGVILTLIRKY